jgi:alanine racemase
MHNAGEFLKLIPKHTMLMAVIKSNAYGHGLATIAGLLSGTRNPDSARDSHIWFGVDSITEALCLRKEGIKNNILVLGATLPERICDAVEHGITITVSTKELLIALAHAPARSAFHLKIDTGMHRQGFLPKDISDMIQMLHKFALVPAGCYSHFAAVNDITMGDFALGQYVVFQDVVAALRHAGYEQMIVHMAATGGTLQYKDAHFDMVRIGIGLYGYWPSENLKASPKGKQVSLKPVLSWKTRIVEIKHISAGEAVGYDCTKIVERNTRIAVLPVGYWHGYDRHLSNRGVVLVCGARAPVLGRISMDMIVIDVTDCTDATVGDIAVLIGTDGDQSMYASELAAHINTTAYEVLTRLNPLMRRLVV